MMSQVLSQTDLTIFARITLVLFITIYVVALIRTFHPSAKPKLEKLGRQIFDERE